MGPAHCTSGAIYCSEISSTLAWGRKVPSLHGVPRGRSTRVLSVERLCTSREDLRTLLPFRPKSYLAAATETRVRSRSSYGSHIDYASCWLDATFCHDGLIIRIIAQFIELMFLSTKIDLQFANSDRQI